MLRVHIRGPIRRQQFAGLASFELQAQGRVADLGAKVHLGRCVVAVVEARLVLFMNSFSGPTKCQQQ
jgi:hypothetical protein